MRVLYHKVIHTPTNKIVASIEKGGLKPRVASEYKDLVPAPIRGKPVVWLASQMHSYIDAPVFAVRVENLDKVKLHRVTDEKLNWWVYQGNIPPSDISRVRIPSPTQRENYDMS